MAMERLNFHITDRCQLNCDHCLRDPGAKATDIDLDVMASAMDQAYELFGTRHVGLTGGEPTLHPRFIEIIDLIADRGCTWHMVTNGERFGRTVQKLAERPERLELLKKVNFSVDGATEETHDSIREQGSFRNVMQAISLCKMREIGFVMQITVNARNVHEIEAMGMLASQLEADKVAYNFTQATGTFLDQSLYLPAHEWERAMDRIERVGKLFRIEVIYADSGRHLQPLQMCEMWKHESVHVNHHGEMSLCCQHSGVPSEGGISDVCGDLHEVSLAEAHGRFTETVNHLLDARVKALQKGKELGEWDRHFSCNWCLKQLGRPHWTEDGVEGPEASRARWRGRWAPGYKDSHVKVDPTLVQLRTGPVDDAAE